MTTVEDIRAAVRRIWFGDRGTWLDVEHFFDAFPADGVIVTAPQAAFTEAWEAAEKACPEGWHLSQVCAPLRSAPSQWAVIAAPDDWNGPDSVNAYGPTPTAALVALREQLEAMG